MQKSKIFLTFDSNIKGMKRFFWLYIVLWTLCSCSKEKAEPEILWQSYFPMQIGTTRLYECTKINVDVLAGKNDTSIFYIRETIAAQVNDTNSCKVMAVNSDYSEQSNGPWQPYSSTSLWNYGNSIVRVEDNVAYQILRFPAKVDYTWDLNVYNTNEEQSAYYEKINVSDTVLNCVYDSVLVVSQQDFKSLYTWQYSEEKYAKNVGMIYRMTVDVESQPNHATIDLSKPIEERITKGTIVSLQLVDKL